MPHHQYRCESCGNTIRAEKVEKRHAGTKRIARELPPSLLCDCTPGGHAMLREEFVPPRREVSSR